MSTETVISEARACDLCGETALYDARTHFGSWAYLCQLHFEDVTDGRLGTGYGQRLVVAP